MTIRPEIYELIEKSKEGSPEALGELVECYADRLYGFFFRLTSNRDTSEELVSELFLRLVRKIRHCETGSFEKWLFTVASNLFRDHLRKQYRRQKLLDEKIRREEEDTGPGREDPEFTDRLQVALKRLDEQTAELIMLRFYGDMSFKELAEMKDEPIGTVLSKVHRGLKRLKEYMDS